jgi:DNA-binding NtrC family response regulator
MSPREVLRPEHFPAHLLRFGHGVRKETSPAATGTDGEEPPGNAPGSLASVKADAERSAILSALAAAGGNRTKAAELLRIHRVKLHEKIKRYGIAGPSGQKM